MGYKFILANSLVEKVLGEDFKVLDTFSGKDLENKEYEQLITMDFICRGINSQRAFGAFITELEERYNSKAKSVHLY